ncbi:MAG: protein-disulfide reductase DsbD domain-containing protein, partial [Novosphingobium sp.]
MPRVVRLILALCAAMLTAGPAFAATTHIRAELIAERTSIAPGETGTLAVWMRPEPGWHGYWENPGDAGFGMSFRWTLPPGAKVGAPRYPVPGTLLIAGLMNHVYEHDYALLVPLTVPATATPGTMLTVSAEADWLACTNEICVPERGRLAATIPVGARGAADPRFDEWRRRLPAPLTETGQFAAAGKRLRLA